MNIKFTKFTVHFYTYPESAGFSVAMRSMNSASVSGLKVTGMIQ